MVRSSLLVIALSQLTTAAEIDFDKHVAPIFVSHCLDCHSGSEPKGGLALSQLASVMRGGESGKAIVVSSASKSLLWQRIHDDEMPPKHPLNDNDKATIKQWINDGAEWGTDPIDPFATTTSTRAGRDWWSLQSLRDVSVPKSDDAWVRTNIDAFVLRRLREKKLRPAPAADPRVLIRRLYFDLIGLPPTPETVEKFVADPSDAAYEQVVDELLASKYFGERWARHWLDVVRFGESDGFERNNTRENAWPYRDWVIDALNRDMPYDEFVRRQLIGDQLDAGPDGAASTGFWVAGVNNTVVGGSKRMKQLARQDQIEEVLATVGQTFLGLTVNCARCHDHKFDPITQKEFYQLSSAISGLGYGERTVKSADAAATLAETNARLSRIRKQLSEIDHKARTAILKEREQGTIETPDPPAAFARWEFDDDLKDSIGNLHGKAVGSAKIENGALVVDGSGFVETAPLTKDIAEKTLEVWVQLDNLDQRGGGAITIETRNGVVFDSIVFGEREPRCWMAGSNGFVRSESLQGTEETAAIKRPVHIALVYHTDGTIVGYRDGVAYGRAIRKSGLQQYKAGETEFIFGLRHKPTGSNRNMRAKIHRAAFYNRALSAEEVAASSGNVAAYVPEEQIVSWLSEDARVQRTSLKKEIAQLTKQHDAQAAKANQKIYTLTARTGTTTNVLLRGDPDNVGEVVAPAGVAAVQGTRANFGLAPDSPEPERRKQLSAWITDRQNPLFARVIVNRIWHYHFGVGIVDTPSDFGFNGGRPSHPDLLEHLATTFRDGGFRMKSLHRMIVTSNVYRQASFGTNHERRRVAMSIDAGNRLLWKARLRRLEAESIRDAMLRVSGKLNDEMGGPSFKDVSVTFNSGTTYYEPLDVDGDAFFRRTIYRFNPRGGRSALLDTFDCPDPAATAPRRAVTTTPLQALSLLNNAFVLRMSDYFAQRVQREAGDEVDEQVMLAWKLAVARNPTDDELRLSRDLVNKHGLTALGRGLFNSNEFVIIE